MHMHGGLRLGSMRCEACEACSRRESRRTVRRALPQLPRVGTVGDHGGADDLKFREQFTYLDSNSR
jgi:hypothetical protein